MEEIKVISIIKKVMESDKVPHAILLEKSYGYNLEKIEGIILKRILNKSVASIENESAVFKINGSKIDRELLSRLQTSFSTTSISNHDAKIIIIDDYELVSKQISNAMLKLIEEPQKNRYIILNTNNLSSVPKTIISRCQKYKISSTNYHIWSNEAEKHFFEEVSVKLTTSALETIDLRPFLIETLDKKTYKWKLGVIKRTLFAIWSGSNNMSLNLTESDHKVIISLVPYVSFRDVSFEHLMEVIDMFISTKTLNFEIALANFLIDLCRQEGINE